MPTTAIIIIHTYKCEKDDGQFSFHFFICVIRCAIHFNRSLPCVYHTLIPAVAKVIHMLCLYTNLNSMFTIRQTKAHRKKNVHNKRWG